VEKERDDGKLCLDPLTDAKGNASSFNSHFKGVAPFKLKVKFDIPIFEVQIEAYAIDKQLNLLEGYFSVHDFSDR